MLELDNAIAEVSSELSNELKSDKAYLRRENEKLQRKLDVANKGILGLSVDKKGLEKDVQFFRDTNLSREIGAGVLAFCGVMAPLLPVEWWSVKWFCMLYGGVVLGVITSVGLGIYFSRKRTE